MSRTAGGKTGTGPHQQVLMGGSPSLGPESEAVLLGLGVLLLMAICSHVDHLLPHIEQMPVWS